MIDFLVCFSWLIGGQTHLKRHPTPDRKMIGEQMNSVHSTHIGTKELACRVPLDEQIQGQMNSKSDYNNIHEANYQIQLNLPTTAMLQS
uniref:CRIB domain-containing protein n=1 Tax=Salvator merianae TaxID=96440 RepID=A0A8D0BLS8_SALMN